MSVFRDRLLLVLQRGMRRSSRVAWAGEGLHCIAYLSDAYAVVQGAAQHELGGNEALAAQV